MRAVALLAGGLMMVGAAAVQAAPIVQTFTFGPGLTDFNGTGPGTTNLNLFDSSTGTLNSIGIFVSYSFTSAVTVTNSGATTSTGNVRVESGAQFSSTNAGINTALATLLNDEGPLGIGASILDPAALYRQTPALAGAFSLAPTSSTVLNLVGALVSANPTTTNAAFLAAFSAPGGGSWDLALRTLTGTVLSSLGGNTSADEDTFATSVFTLTYNWTPPPPPPPTGVPEPMSLALLATGLLGLGAAHRMHRRRRDDLAA